MNELPEKYLDKVKEYSNNSSVLYTIDDALMEYMGDYASNETIKKSNVINLKPQYSEYTKNNVPYWNVIYFHFQSLNKCVIFHQIDHPIGDAIMLGEVIQNMYVKMYGSTNYAPVGKPLVRKSGKKRRRNFFWFKSIFTILNDLIFNPPDPSKDDPNYPSFNRQLSEDNYLSLGPAIEVKKLSRVAKAQKVTCANNNNTTNNNNVDMQCIRILIL